jgi:hypothetical protein
MYELVSVYQTVARGPQVVRLGPKMVSEEKLWQKLYQTLNEWKIHPHVSVLKLRLLVDFQNKLVELILSTTSCRTIIILENA